VEERVEKEPHCIRKRLCRDDIPIRYGLVKPQRSHNPFKVEFSAWLELLRDMRTAPDLKSALLHVLMPPAWTPSEVAQHDHIGLP
jgi:hypothetical protein